MTGLESNGAGLQRLSDADARGLVDVEVAALLPAAQRLRAAGKGSLVTYSPKVFIPLTKLCRDVCHYCTFAQPPRRGERAYMTADEVLAVARAGAEAGCHEALFTLGDKPELRYRVAREELAALGCETTIEYLSRMAELVLEETGLLPHVNPGVMTAPELELLRGVSVSQGIMLETISERLSERGGPHFGSPDKRPDVRLETLRLAGELQIPFTTGILIGIGETRKSASTRCSRSATCTSGTATSRRSSSRTSARRPTRRWPPTLSRRSTICSGRPLPPAWSSAPP